ncbi:MULTISPECIES: prophage endopeptidase tail family protein [unclassified Paenibacillus]|uniref:prophage endopeptidase tail family protein n=1 Tax=unclassified Paenibacillus TaxID=185978 RepID=UPI0009CC223C|nr:MULTISPECIES: prophage endopeptidase tail family protein [unclassified Paenibacillus]SLJ98075.1 phage minor structural protein, N-terminal region [Paenibacillus sp. RU5A]SOC66823.1 phage minor structural protein, N-terminal region [Paenibacillus sp. RU26A]SOC70028.1 phage minor structural protein, N-terminal region [Paenibacillus sp. RU5M]
MKYLKVLDKNLKPEGYLTHAYEVERRRRVNSDYELSFFVSMTSDDYREKIKIKGHVMDENGQYYVIQTRERVRDGKKLTARIVATHVMFKMNEFKVPYDQYLEEAYGVHISQMISRLSPIMNNKYTFKVDDIFELQDIKDWGRTTALEAFNHIVKSYGAEVWADNFTIHLRKKVGKDEGKQYRIGKDIIQDQFKDEGSNLVTRMYSQMKDGRTFIGMSTTYLTAEELSLLQGVPGAIQNGKLAVNYLVSPYAQYWTNTTNVFYDGEMIDQDIEDPEKLLKATREELRKKEIPEIEISINAVDIHKIDRIESPPDMGDIVYAFDPEMEMPNIEMRVMEMTEYPFSMDKHTQVVLANFKVQDYDDIIADLERSKRIMNDLLSGGKIRTDVFETFAKQAVIDINNSKTQIIYDERGILLQSKIDVRNQVILTSDGIVLTTDGGKTPRVAITGQGVLAEAIRGVLGDFVSMIIGSGNLVTKINTQGISSGHSDYNQAPFRVDMAGNVVARSIKLTGQIDNSTMLSSLIQASRIVGNEIEGGTITGSLIRTAANGRRIEQDINGFRTYDGNNRNRIRITTGSNDEIAAISWYGSGGAFAGEINSYQNSGGLSIISNDLIIGSNNTGNPIRLQGAPIVAGPAEFRSNVSFVNSNITGLAISNVSGLLAELNSIWTAVNGKAASNHTHTQYAVNMTYDPSTKNLKLFNQSGSAIATVNIS